MAIKKVVFLLVMLLIFSVSARSLDTACTTKEQARLKALVEATQVTYELYDETGEYNQTFKSFRVTISGFKPDFYVANEENGIYFEDANNGAPSNAGYPPNTTLTLPFYASNQGVCRGYLIMTKYVQLPPYNMYSQDPLCVGHETYELCNKYSPIQIASQEEFEERMKSYLKSLEDDDDQNNPPPNQTKTTPTLWDNIMSFLLTYNLFFLLPIVVIGTAGIVIIEVRKRRSIL